ncbi:MAG: hypothetical protein Q8891_06790 [Bacteroidota bacterium]|nr:hypothetical protein [Bacteroidota bacterium]
MKNKTKSKDIKIVETKKEKSLFENKGIMILLCSTKDNHVKSSKYEFSYNCLINLKGM